MYNFISRNKESYSLNQASLNFEMRVILDLDFTFVFMVVKLLKGNRNGELANQSC